MPFRSVRQANVALPLPSRPAPSAIRWFSNGGVSTFLVIAGAIFLASLLGLASRHAFSVSFWPANGVLVGLLIRERRHIRPAGWLGAALGYIAADLIFGRTLSLAAMFAMTNIIGTAVATFLLLRLDRGDLGLRRIHSVLRILACLLPACLAAASCGAILVRIQFGGSIGQTLLTWPASELVNYLIVLPAMLTVSRSHPAPLVSAARRNRQTIWPAIGLLLSCVAAVVFDGPGSIMFPMPALLLCALTYTISTTSLLTLALGTGCLTAIGLGIVDIGQDMSDPHMVVSVRIATAFLALVPLTISSAMAVRDDLLHQLRDAAHHDGLTGLLNRRAFELHMAQWLTTRPAPGRGLAVLWLDLDHFKRINDTHGHPAGDAVLQEFAAIARRFCGDDALIGRLGGEEFAVIADAASRPLALAIADDLRAGFAADGVAWNGADIRATLSMGACYLDAPCPNIADLVRRLDETLYLAKRNGRNRIEWLSA